MAVKSALDFLRRCCSAKFILSMSSIEGYCLSVKRVDLVLLSPLFMVLRIQLPITITSYKITIENEEHII